VNAIQSTKRSLHIQRCIATKGDGLAEGFAWISEQVSPNKKAATTQDVLVKVA